MSTSLLKVVKFDRRRKRVWAGKVGESQETRCQIISLLRVAAI